MKKKIIIDTNCWISFLIGKQLHNLVPLLSNDDIELILSDELLEEIFTITQRPKFSKYFPIDKVLSLIDFMRIKGFVINPDRKSTVCRDVADNFILDLAICSNADYIVTGDNDLLVLKKIGNCLIINAMTFEQLCLK